MKIKDLKIGTQLLIGFSINLLLVIVLSIVSVNQNYTLEKHTDDMYNHPYKVRVAIGKLEHNIDGAMIIQRNLLLDKSNKEISSAIAEMEILTNDATKQIDILRMQYLGSQSDVENLSNAFVTWEISREENTKLIQLGEYEKVKLNILPNGKTGKARESLLNQIKLIDDFATKKAASFYSTCKENVSKMSMELIFFTILILLISIYINYRLIRNIRTPLIELADTEKRFDEGDMNARNVYSSKNEIGFLASIFNSLAENIQSKFSLNKMITEISAVMMNDDDEKTFFHNTLTALMKNTESQIGAIYLLSENKKTFEHFKSIGGDENIKKTFSVIDFEGEFGGALAMRSIQHVQNISDKTRFEFNTVNGKFIPHEIITIPIITGKELIAVISLASIYKYKPEALQVVNQIHLTMSARIEGILIYQKNKEFLQKLELQNIELEAQKTELEAQSAEVILQNTELEMQKKQLSEVSRLKTNFLSNMSHELRTPLNSVIALSGVLNRRLKNKISDEENSYLEVIERNGKSLLHLINDILDISRIESGKEETMISTFNAKKIIDEVINMIQPQADEKNIGLLKTFDESAIEIKTDEKKLNHILQNLIGNAVKFTEKGSVELNIEQTIKNINITISDTGIGISDENIAHIFDEFKQADGSTSRKFGGTGLGLAIAKKYANILGGTISVKSVFGKGSVFTLCLPVTYHLDNRIIDEEDVSDLKFAIKPATIHASTIQSSKTILLVEDSEPAIIQIRDVLEETGFNIIVAHNGEKALQIISNTIPDSIILDLMMPGIDGFEVLNQLRGNELTASIPVLILTAKHLTKEDLKTLKRNNVHQLIQKGDVNRKELLNTITSMVFPQPEIEKSKIVNQKYKITGKPSVLVVEDNADNMTTMRALLSEDYKMIESVNGKIAIDMAQQHVPNLILMDIALPDMDGIETFKIIRNNPLLKHIPILALTASAMTSDRETILAHGFDAYIAKPIDDKIFFKTIREILYGE